MNHTNTARSVNGHVVEYNNVKAERPRCASAHIRRDKLPIQPRKTGSLQLFPELLLWGIDFNLYCASVGIKRVHMHMGTDYRVSAALWLIRFAWQFGAYQLLNLASTAPGSL